MNIYFDYYQQQKMFAVSDLAGINGHLKKIQSDIMVLLYIKLYCLIIPFVLIFVRGVCASSCTCMLVREKLIHLMNCRCKGLRKPQHWRFSLCINRLRYIIRELLYCHVFSVAHITYMSSSFFTHSRPGILVLINDADWELMVSVCVCVCVVQFLNHSFQSLF